MSWRLAAKRVAIAALALVVLGAVAHLACTAWARGEERAARAAIVAADAPTTMSTVRPPVPPDEDAAPAWYRAVSLLHDGPVGPDAFARDVPSARSAKPRREFVMGASGALPLRVEPATWTPAERDAVVAACDGQPALWRALAQATDAPRCRFPLRYEDGPGVLLPQITWLRGALNLIRLRLALDGERGDGADACVWAARALRIADHLDDDALVITHLVADAVRAAALAAIAPSIGSCSDDDALRALASAAATADPQRGLTAAVDGERVAFGDWNGAPPDDLLGVGGGLDHLGWRLYWSWLGEPLRLHDDACYLRAMLAARGGGEPPLPRLAPRTRLLVPAIAICRQHDEEIARRCDLIVAAVAARRFRLATGAPPSSLADLADRLARPPRATSGVALTGDAAGVTITVDDPVPTNASRSEAARASRAATFRVVLAR